LATASLGELEQLPARVTEGFAQRNVDIAMPIRAVALTIGMNLGAWNVQIHLHDEHPAIRMLVMPPLDGDMTLADSIIVSPESAGEFHRSGDQGGRSVDVPECNGNWAHVHLQLMDIRAINAGNGLWDGLEPTPINWATTMRTPAIEPGLQSM
jgi:hypothetical protein